MSMIATFKEGRTTGFLKANDLQKEYAYDIPHSIRTEEIAKMLSNKQKATIDGDTMLAKYLHGVYCGFSISTRLGDII